MVGQGGPGGAAGLRPVSEIRTAVDAPQPPHRANGAC